MTTATTALFEHTEQQPLSKQLREHTLAAHEDAETSDFMDRLLKGQLSREAVAEYHAQMWFIYDALEHAVRTVASSPIGACYADPRLERRMALDSDLVSMVGPHWGEQVRVMPATAAYVERIEKMDLPGNEVLVLAHHYVRYLGDVSGGQVISRMLQRHYGMGEQELSFYDFSAVGKIKPYRDAYRATLDSLQLTDQQRTDLLEEAVAAFRCNFELFAALSRRFPAES
ncbi:biliverdin-producing heme oxygenase [Corynebacterium pseudodiphtheriticum]|uniref:biliverdin-producing heme oxygenase n=1 Tax=Corynebacterium pseudodiphtheriticum TaxID=37637 RepID=UPI002543E594|nr:biliverdin-producing heme oxygenase [Corynebacterium pseudodiphtheriticum]MDK4240360.1 biliverdin-producing heme oxygenase [Corynebacterium pseudodiphtheriticum]MDK8700598.1 biliverdin-producing heme oxygenase [Corynebacterium pseudodiphtheriticum]MDK8774632.1 biliverdin-producing heme oxygenase [Corynebacterium pseudodiphtheriticum]